MGKQYAILRVQKCKGAEIGAMQYHNDREPGKHTNPDIDQSRTRMNRELCPHADYEGEVQARIDAGYKGTRKVRKDAVRLVEGIVTASPEFFEGASAEEVRDFFEDALGFCREEFGESNLVHFTVHMDEETPHAHFGFVPLRDGKLSWKGFFPDKAALGAMQDRFYGRVGALYGLSRGEKRLEGQPARRHKSVAEYKAESRRVQAELDEKAGLLESARAELASANADLASARAQLAEREAFFYPPYARLTLLTLRHRDVALLRRGITELAARLRGRFGRRVLGPMTPPVDRIRGEYLAGLLLKGESGASSARARELLGAELKAFSEDPEFRNITVVVNVDPQ